MVVGGKQLDVQILKKIRKKVMYNETDNIH